VHDVSDILVDVLKMVNYLKLESKQGFFASELAYASCVAGWVYWRLYRFPFTAIRGALVESFRVVAPQPRLSWEGALGIMVTDMPLYFEMNGLLLTLQALHIYWFYLFAMIGYRILTESAREASRQEYEGDSDDETTNPTKKQQQQQQQQQKALLTAGGEKAASGGASSDSQGGVRQRKK
jgi:TLC domain